ncbi:MULTISPECIES: GNAT family N-acetyltransferase [unclassified Desulfovibrio]|uniref:GNAT family N-acetyltransferase n=1 Tax=unclassified Desulfovibrio TaxID=2593640 RepID=UPI0013EC2BBA|nr:MULTISPECIES: GNAT family N-acetyltransferase [unclassified Desulfovibrio]
MKLLFDFLMPDMERGGFTCGEPALDTYLHKQAGQDMRRSFATVIAARPKANPNKVVDFSTFSAASIIFTSLPNEIARKIPRSPAVPAIRLGRLAVNASQQGKHIGSLLVLDALRRACRNELAWAIILVNTKNENAAIFY